MKKILFTGGGSAGHTVPNIALINELLSQGKTDICYMGGEGIEKDLIAPLHIPYYTIRCPKLVRGGGFSALKNNLSIPRRLRAAVKEAEKGLRLFAPDLVFSKGGYVALPVALAARRLRIPCFAHESDYSLGLANRLSAKKCEKMFTSFPETAKKLKNGYYSGAPIRRELFARNRETARREWNIPDKERVLLVFGGGSGSASVNDALRALLPDLTKKYLVLHACGKGNVVESNLKNYRQYEFIADMGGAYACADLVVSRAGAGAVFELMALKKPALFIPLEGATRGDQGQNAAYFERRGLCRVLPQGALSKLGEAIDGAFSDEGLKRRLLESGYSAGNTRILDVLRAYLG